MAQAYNPSTRKLKKKDFEFVTSLDYIVRPHQNKQNKTKQAKTQTKII